MPGEPLWVATIWLAIFGVVGTAIQGFFLKIASFLVWLKRYAPVAGRQTVPKLEQLSNRTLAWCGLGLWMVGNLVVAGALLADTELVRLAAPLLMAAGACWVVNVVRIASHWRNGGLTLREPVVAGRTHALRNSG
jgi:hypothetical protein